MSLEVRWAVPIPRMYDVAARIRFYVEYLGGSVDWPEGDGDRPVYVQVSRGGLRLHLSSHHDDGTPGTAVRVVTEGVEAPHAELATHGCPFLNPVEPGPGDGRELQLIDPASNRIRFYEPPPRT